MIHDHRGWPTLSRVEEEWFATYDEDELDEAQQAVLNILRARAHTDRWPLDPPNTNLAFPYDVSYGYPLPPGETSLGKVLAWLDLVDREQNLVLLTVGVYFDESGMRGDRLHNQLLTLPDEPTDLAVAGTGSPEETARRAADWFHELLRRPIVRYEWLRAGEVYARRWLFADSGDGLVEGRIGSGKLGSPDRVIHVRGDRP
jgi:hypothetical protein